MNQKLFVLACTPFILFTFVYTLPLIIIFPLKTLNSLDLVTIHTLSNTAGMLFCGGTAVLAFFILFLLIKSKEIIYLHYSLFLIFILLYGIIQLKSIPQLNQSLEHSLSIYKRLIEPLTILSFSFYIFFAIELMSIKNQNKKLYKVLSYFAYSAIAYSVLYYLLFNYFYVWERNVFLVARSIIFPLSLICILCIQWKVKSPLKPYFIVGSIAYFLGALVASVRHTVYDLPFPSFYNIIAPIYFEMGITFEILCFGLALGHRINLLHEEKHQTSKDLIHQLSINSNMFKNMNKQLELEVAERTKEIINSQSRLIEQEQKFQLAEYERELAESEMLARRLQVNPHFIFNCLNAIRYLIQSAQNEKASLYLVIFSKFIRMVLDSSEKSVIPIKEELEIIENYLKLEKERFDNDFSYTIHIAVDVDLETFIPPLLLQPIVENAIWHGLLNSPKVIKTVSVEIRNVGNVIFIIIDDNGIGRKEANHFSIKKLYKSMGLSLTKERIELYNHNYNNTLNFEIVDKIDNNEISLGTRVVLRIESEPKT